MNRFWLYPLFLLLCGVSAGMAQQDAEAVLNAVVKNYNKVHDYQADVKITADIPFIRILPMQAKIYFRQPGNMRLISRGIAILPRQGFDEMYKSITDRKSFTVVPQGTEILEGVHVSIISILPLSDTMEVILGKFWIDPVRKVILKSQMTTRTNGTVTAAYRYGDYAEYGLPDRMTFLVDVKKFKIPKTVAVDINTVTKENTTKNKEGKKGKIEIELFRYIINKGVPDDVFKEAD